MSLTHQSSKKPKPSFSSFSAAFHSSSSISSPPTTHDEPKEPNELIDNSVKEKQTKNEIYFKEVLKTLNAFQADFAQVKRELADLKSVVHEIHRAL